MGRESSRASITFLLVAPRQGLDRDLDRAGPDVEGLHQLLGILADLVPLQDAPLAVGRLVVPVEDQVLGDRERQDQPIPLPVFGV